MTGAPDLLAEAKRRGDLAERLLGNGYFTVMVSPEDKRAMRTGWKVHPARGRHFVEETKKSGAVPNIGIRCADLVAIDVDEEETGRAHLLVETARLLLGATDLERIGAPPRRLLVYRRVGDVMAWKPAGIPVEVKTGDGHQFVGFGLHPSGRLYTWAGDTPEHVLPGHLPGVDMDQLERFQHAVRGFYPQTDSAQVNRSQTVGNKNKTGEVHQQSKPTPSTRSGRATEGRYIILRRIVGEETTRAFDEGEVDPKRIAAWVWHRFQAEADPSIPRDRKGRLWTHKDAEAMVGGDLRKLAKGVKIPLDRRFWTAATKAAFLTRWNVGRSDAAIRVGSAIVHFAGGPDATCGASLETLAAHAGVNEKTAFAWRRAFIETGFGTQVQAGKFNPRRRSGLATVLRLNPAIVAELAAVEADSPPGRATFPEQSAAAHSFGPQPFERSNDNDEVHQHSGYRYLTIPPPLGEARPVDPRTLTAPQSAPSCASDLALARWPDLFHRSLAGVVESRPGAPKSAVGAALRALREERGLSQTEAARRAGISQGSLANGERGHDGLHPARVARLIEILDAA